MDLCLRTPDGAVTVVEFSHDAGVSDVTAAFSKLMSYPVHVGSIAAFEGCDGSERLSATGVADGDEVSVSLPTASERLACFPSDRHHDVARRLYWGGSLLDIYVGADAVRMLEHARCLAELGHPATANGNLYSRKLTELGGPIWVLGHETWLSDVVREYVLAQPEDFAPFEGRLDGAFDALRSGVHHLPRAIMEDNFFRRCQAGRFGGVRASLVAETAARWGDGHALCKVASLIPDSLSVIAESTAAFADTVWTCREAAMPDARYVHTQGASGDTLPEAIPEDYCVMEDPLLWRRTLYLDMRAISVAAKHGVSVEQMWQSLSAHMLLCADKRPLSPEFGDWRLRARIREHETRQWLAACWRLLTLGLDPETRGARGVRGLHLCVRLRSRAGCLVFLAAGADRANVRTVGPCFDAEKGCASDCACHSHHSGVGRLRCLEAGKYPETCLNDVAADMECYCNTCQYRVYCDRRRAYLADGDAAVDHLPDEPEPWGEKDSRMERNGRMHTWRVRSNRSRATRT